MHVFRAMKLFVAGVASLTVIGVAAVILFWLGRSKPPVRSELVVDYDDDDLGQDVDGESS